MGVIVIHCIFSITGICPGSGQVAFLCSVTDIAAVTATAIKNNSKRYIMTTANGTTYDHIISRIETAKPPPGAMYIFILDFEVTFSVEMTYASALVR